IIPKALAKTAPASSRHLGQLDMNHLRLVGPKVREVRVVGFQMEIWRLFLLVSQLRYERKQPTPLFATRQWANSGEYRRMSSLFCSMPMAIHQFAGLSSIKPDVSKDRSRVVPSSIRLSCCYMKPLGLSIRQERLQMVLAAMLVEAG